MAYSAKKRYNLAIINGINPRASPGPIGLRGKPRGNPHSVIMTKISHIQLNPLVIDPIGDEDTFEDFCCELAREIWCDPTAQRNGRKGHKQNGVDIFGSDVNGKVLGMQCKKKDLVLDGKLTEENINEEVEKAKTFDPPLSRYIIATTLSRDPELQKIALKITIEHKKGGLFSVEIWSWDEIRQYLEKAKEVLYQYYPHLKPGLDTEAVINKIDSLLTNSQSQIKEKTDAAISQSENVISENNLSIKGDDTNTVNHTKLDNIRDSLGKNPETALNQLEELKKDLWSKADKKIKFRIATNIAAAKLEMNKEEDAGQLFIDAFQYAEEDEKALCNLSLGHFLINDKKKANEIAREAIKKFPTSSRAYALLIQTTDSEDVNSIISEIPEGLLKSKDIAFALGIIFRERGDLVETAKWLEIANDHEDTEPVIKAALGETKLKIALNDPELVIAGQMTDESKALMENSEALFTEAWNSVSNSEISKYKAIWLANRCLANRMLGKVDEAIRDIGIALGIEPNNPDYLKQKAMILHERGDNEQAVTVLKSILDSKANPEIPIMVAGLLWGINEFDEAEKALLGLIESDCDDSRIMSDAKSLLVKLYIDMGKIDEAEKTSEDMLKSDPQNIIGLVDSAKVDVARGESDKANMTLRTAKKYINEKTPKREMLALADQFYSMDYFEDAADIFLKFVDLTTDSPLLRKLLNCYYRSGKNGEALKICKSLFDRYGSLEFVTEIESAIYEEIGDLNNAKRVCDAYIKKFPNDVNMQVRLAVVNFRLNNFGEVDAFLDKKIDINKEKYNFFSLMQIINLLEVRGFHKKALDLMYGITRKFSDKEEANMQYLGLFFRREKDNDKYLDREKVEIDSAVLLEDEGKQTKWYILEEREDPILNQGEINKKHELYNLLIGKKVGDVLILKKGQFDETKLKIKDIKSKFVYLLNQIMGNFGKNFPSANSLQSIHVDAKTLKDKTEERPAWIEKIFSQINKKHERQLIVEKFYKDGESTIGALSELMGNDIFKTWGFMVSRPDLGVRSSIGTKEERDNSMAVLRKNKEVKLVIDAISIFTIHELDIADEVIKNYGRMGIAQSTIDLIKEMIFERKGIEAKGYMTIGKDGDQYVREEISAEKIQKNKEYLEKIISWIEQNCDVIPCTAALDLTSEQKKVSNMLGKSFFDTILICTKDNNILFSDDERLRSLATTEYEVEGVWSQLLLMDLLSREAINKDSYAKYVVRLVELNYYYTSINKDAILQAAKSSDWEFKGSLFSIIQKLKGNYSDENSSIKVIVEFMHSAWTEIPEKNKEDIIFGSLDALIENRSKEIVLSKFVMAVKSYFQSNPLDREFILTLVRKYIKK